MVGPQEKKYHVHKRIICPASSFFGSACNGDWKEGSEGLVKLPEVEPHIFEVYLCWVYTKEIDVVSEVTDTQPPNRKYDKARMNDAFGSVFLRMVGAFALGDMLNDAVFTNAIIDEFVLLCKSSECLPSAALLETAWRKLPEQSGMMKAIVDDYAVRMPPTEFKDCAAELPPAFVANVAHACFRDRELALSARGIFKRPRCFYHDHLTGESKTKCCKADVSSTQSQ